MRCGLQCDVGFNAGTNGADGGTQPVLLGDQHGHHLAPAGSQRVEDLGLGVLEGAYLDPDATGGRTASAKWARTPASRVSVLASVPVALAKSLTWRGLTTTTGSAAAARAATKLDFTHNLEKV